MTRQTCCRFSPNGARNPHPRTTGMAGRWAKPFPSLFPKTALFFFYLYLQQYTPQEGALVAASARPSLWHRPSNPAILCALTKAFPYGVKKRHLFYKWLCMCLYTHRKGRASHQSSVFTLIAFAKCGKSVTALSAQSRWQQFDFTEHSSRKARVLRHFSLFWYCHVLLTFQNSSCILWLKGSGRSAFTDTFWC